MKQSWTTRICMIKSERGFTLVELLATIVILGIIAAIAVPSIGNIMDNSKKDAHVANAEQIIEAARLKITSEAISENTTIKLVDLELEGFLDSIPKVPGTDSTYDKDATEVYFTVNNTNNRNYSILLKGQENIFAKKIKEEDLNRTKVRNLK